MKKRILAIALAIISVFSALTSCRQTPNEDSPIETTAAPGTTKEIHEEPVLHSFYSGQVLYSYDQIRHTG